MHVIYISVRKNNNVTSNYTASHFPPQVLQGLWNSSHKDLVLIPESLWAEPGAHYWLILLPWRSMEKVLLRILSESVEKEHFSLEQFSCSSCKYGLGSTIPCAKQRACVTTYWSYFLWTGTFSFLYLGQSKFQLSAAHEKCDVCTKPENNLPSWQNLKCASKLWNTRKPQHMQLLFSVDAFVLPLTHPFPLSAHSRTYHSKQ